MKMTKMMIAGGLVLTLGAFSPVFAQSSNGSTAQNTSYSDTSNSSSSPSSSASASDQDQDKDQNSSSAQPSDKSDSSQNSASDNQQDQTSNQQDQQDQTSSSQSSKNQTEASASATDLNQQQDRIQRQIRHLDRDLSDAESYEAKAREAWNSNDTAQAQRDFRTAEHILKMATGGGSYQAAMLGENPQQQERMTEKAIKHAKSNGTDVSDAEQYYKDGKDALNKGNNTEASRDFRAAQLAAGVPVEVGYAEVWEAKVPVSEREKQMAAASQEGSESQPNDQNAMNSDTDQTQKDDAQMFLRHGQEALKNGDKTQAQRDFRAAERALSMNETSGNYATSSK